MKEIPGTLVEDANYDQLEEEFEEMTLYAKSNRFKSRPHHASKTTALSACGKCGGIRLSRKY